MLMLLVMQAAWSCSKDEKRIYFEGANAPVISVNTNGAIVLTKDEPNKPVLNIKWTNPEYAFTTGVNSQNVSYSLEMDTVGANFASSIKKTYNIVSDLNKAFTSQELNAVLVNSMQLAVNEPHQLEVRVVSSLNKSAITQMISNTVKITVTPYDQPIIITYLYLPGEYQGWAPGVAPSVGSINTKNFEGYVYISMDKTPFKITNQPNWDGTNYGTDGGNKISSTGGDITFPGTKNTYFFTVDLGSLTWNYSAVSWGMIGAATPGGWDNDTQMTYNPTTKKFEIPSIQLAADEFKFRANNKWDVNFGAGASSTSLEYNSGNLKVPAAGTYKVELDLSRPLQYTFKLTKL